MSKSIKRIAIVNTKSSFNDANAREALDLALIYAAFDQQVTVIFMHDGVYQLLKDQQAKLLDTKDFLATMKTFELYDIEQVIACSDSLNERGIASNDISLPHQTHSRQALKKLWAEFDHVLTI